MGEEGGGVERRGSGAMLQHRRASCKHSTIMIEQNQASSTTVGIQSRCATTFTPAATEMTEEPQQVEMDCFGFYGLY